MQNPISTRRFMGTALLSAVAMSVASVASAQSMYDGFDYPVNTAAPLDGGNGYNGAWFRTTVNEDFETVETTAIDGATIVPGLTYIKGRPIVSKGNAFSPKPGVNDIKRRTAVPISGDPDVGGNRSTVWMSFLFKSGLSPEDGNLVSLTREFSDFIPRLTLSASRRNTATGVENYARASMWDQFGSRGPGFDDATNAGTGPVMDASTHLLVLEYIPDNTPPSINQGTLRAYLDPALDGATPTASSAFGETNNYTEGVQAFTRMRIYSAAGSEALRSIFDEVRVGTTFAEAVRQARPGDADANGTVNFADLVILAQNYNTVAANGWYSGDFSLDGLVNFADLVSLAQNYNTTGLDGSLGGDGFSADWALAQSLVPEPTLLCSLGFSLVTLRRRRR